MNIRIEIGSDICLTLPVPGADRIESVVLHDRGDRGIAVIKEIRRFTGLGLKEAKDASEVTTTFRAADMLGIAPPYNTLGAFADALQSSGASIATSTAPAADPIALLTRIIAVITGTDQENQRE